MNIDGCFRAGGLRIVEKRDTVKVHAYARKCLCKLCDEVDDPDDDVLMVGGDIDGLSCEEQWSRRRTSGSKQTRDEGNDSRALLPLASTRPYAISMPFPAASGSTAISDGACILLSGEADLAAVKTYECLKPPKGHGVSLLGL